MTWRLIDEVVMDNECPVCQRKLVWLPSFSGVTPVCPECQWEPDCDEIEPYDDDWD